MRESKAGWRVNELERVEHRMTHQPDFLTRHCGVGTDEKGKGLGTGSWVLSQRLPQGAGCSGAHVLMQAQGTRG